MSNRRPKRANKKIKIDPSFLQDKYKISTRVWRVNGMQITLRPTKGYTVWKLPKEWLDKAAEVDLVIPEVA